jgi:uncharacterized protein YraI
MAEEPTQNNKKGSSKIWMVIVGVLVVAVIVVLAYVALSDQSSTGGETTNPTPVPPEISVPTAAPGTALVTANVGVNVRSGPSTDYPSYGVAPAGSQAQAIGISQDGGWWNIAVNPQNIPPGNAWVSSEYVTAQNTENLPVVEAPALPPPAEVPPAGENEPKVTAVDVVYVRSGPGTEYPSYGLASLGKTGKVVGKSADGGWWAVELPTTVAPDGMGWVSADWVVAENVENVPVIN